MIIEELNKKLQIFEQERQKQKLRGLNTYNIIKVLRKPHEEVGLHSRFIYSLLDVDGEHNQNDLFVRLFAKYALSLDEFGENIKVEREENADGRRIDFTIKSDKYFIGIEMKIYAHDEDRQISDYYDDLVKKANGKQEVKIYYLTLDGKSATLESHQNKPYTSIAFNKEIINWLNKSKKQVFNITNLNNAIAYYMDIVNMLIGKYESPIKQYKDFFLDEEIYECYDANKDKINLGTSVQNGFMEARQILYNNFYKKLLEDKIINKNDGIAYKKFLFNSDSNGGNIIFLTFDTVYDIRLYIKKDKFVNFSVGINDDADWNNNHKKEIVINRLKHIEKYIIGKIKGVKLQTDHTLPQPTIKNLFLAYENQIEELNNNIVNEIQEHLNIIKQILKTNV